MVVGMQFRAVSFEFREDSENKDFWNVPFLLTHPQMIFILYDSFLA